MRGYQPADSFDEAAARQHDQRGDEAAAVVFLERLAGPGPALELGIGTGRIALPLASRGVRVDGIDISSAMIERLREKPGGRALRVETGDFVEVAVPDCYSLIFVVWNTLFNVLTQERQLRCFRNVAAHLTADGSFVVEAFVPDFLHRMPDHQQMRVEGIAPGAVDLSAIRHDPVAQTLEESHIALSKDGVRLTPVVQRYAWPSELDLMARLAGLHLKARLGGWQQEPFTAASRVHVSVYGY